MNVYLPNGRLPSAYQEVEWIGRNGNNYIETGWIPTTNFTVKVGYKIADSGYRYIILSQYGGGAYNHAVALEINSGNVSNNTVRFYCGNTPTTTQFYSSNSLNLNSFNDITITAPGTINVNGITTTNSSMYTGTYDNKTCRLFIDNDTSFSTFSHNSFISYCKIYEGSTLVRDFVPCYRKSDSVIGLYDLVNNQFYTNSGTGTFSKGNDVTMAVLKNAYIGDVYEYSYDFRNKTASQITADGWSIVANYIQLGANGISGTSTAKGQVKKTINLSGAKKCIFKTNLYISGGSGNRGYISPGFANAQGSFRANGAGSYPGYGLQLNLVSGTRRNQFDETITLNGQYTSTLEVDLVNNKASVTLDGVGTITNNNPDLTTFLSQQFLNISVQNGNSWVQDIKVTIEY